MSGNNQLEAMLAKLPVHRAPEGWRDRVRAAIDVNTPPTDIQPRPRRRPLWIAGGGLVAAAACVAIYFASSDTVAPSGRPSIAMQVAPVVLDQRGGGGAHRGDMILVKASDASALRVYLDGVQIARCPGHPSCIVGPHGLVLALPLASTGILQSIAYRPALPEPSAGWRPSSSDFDADVALATRSQISMVPSDLITVR